LVWQSFFGGEVKVTLGKKTIFIKPPAKADPADLIRIDRLLPAQVGG
jgi:hypothetical protein